MQQYFFQHSVISLLSLENMMYSGIKNKALKTDYGSVSMISRKCILHYNARAYSHCNP